MTSGDYRGPDDVIATFVKQVELTDATFKVEVHDFLGRDGPRSCTRESAPQHNGRSIEEPYAHVCHFRDGKLVEARILDFNPTRVDEFFG